jgi:predicted nucleotide-binding protein
MTEPQEELLQIADRLGGLVDRAKAPEVSEPLTALESAADQMGKSWIGSALGYHAYIYYADLKPPPPGAQFSPEWGLKNTYGRGSRGDWREIDPDEVKKAIQEIADNADLTFGQELAHQAKSEFESDRLEVLSVLTGELTHTKDSFLDSIKQQVEELSIYSEGEVVNQLIPRTAAGWSRDSLAVTQGYRTPPHLKVLSEVRAIQHTVETVEKLSDLARKTGSHLLRQRRQQRRAETVGTNVFIGHGRSLIWRELKDFIEDRLKLPVDEFNRVPAGGVTNIARLSEMLNAAAIAFLIMTGEDEQPDGNLRARMNVVHEAGLFQGRLGFTRAIVLLEEDCEAFSNIEGLGQIRFPKGNIKAAFEEIREILEREDLLSVNE